MKRFEAVILIALTSIFIACNNKKPEDNNPDSNDKESAAIDTAKTKNDTLSHPENAAKGEYALADIYKELEKKPQSFSISISKDTTLICAEGTRISIKANSFIYGKNQQPVNGKVKISVTEYYSIADILLARLSTTTDGKLLETGGMLNITASSANEDCVLRKDSTIGIEFPAKTRKEGMELYNGAWNKKNNMNWTLDKKATDLNKTYSTVDQMPEFPGGNTKLYNLIAKNVSLSGDCEKDGKVIIGFVVDKSGSVTNPRIIRGYDRDCDQVVLNAFSKIPKFIPGKMNGEPVNVYYTLPVKISGMTRELDYDTRTLDQKYNKNTIQKAQTYEVTSYLFRSSNLGWINCDRRWENVGPVEDYIVNVTTDSEASISLVFHNYKTVVNLNFYSAKCLFKNMPANQKVTVVAVKRMNDKVQLAIKEGNTGDKTLDNLVFKQVSLPLLKEEFKKIRSFNQVGL